ncbi:MAG: hypothetical protein PHO96_06660 [Candidatus Izemoplasmatales bacterium]|nr:hypothetical protein [Candidatus Izemoplasmatales bacterium]
MKVVINDCYGGFHLSHKAIMAFAKRKGFDLYAYITSFASNGMKRTPYREGDVKDEIFLSYFKKPLVDGEEDNYYFSVDEIERNDKDLVDIVEILGEESNAFTSSLKVVEIPDDVDFVIEEYDGLESIHEKHRSWS